MMERAIINRTLCDRHGQIPGSLELAYLGDTIFDLYVRSRLIAHGGQMKRTHLAASKIVCAHAQSQALARVEALLTDEEADVVRRARNTRQTPAKHADIAEYHRATGLEALLGYLALSGRYDRIDTLMGEILQGI